MKNKTKYILVGVFIILLTSYVNATGNITGIVCDYNTMLRLENATVNLYLIGSLVNTDLTNVNGEFNFTNKSANNYTITFTVTDYEGQTEDIELLDNTTEDLLIKLIPFSYNAFIKLTFNDLGMNMNDICIYFSNGRLKGCYSMNETIQLYEHQDYYILLKPKEMDIINNPIQSSMTILNYSENILRVIFILVILIIITVVFLRLIKKV